MIYLSNVFSLQMYNHFCFTQKITLYDAKKALCPTNYTGDFENNQKYHNTGKIILKAKSIIDNKDICSLINKNLGLTDIYHCNKEFIKLQTGDIIYIGQYISKKSEIDTIKWYKITCIRFNALKRAKSFLEFCHPNNQTGYKIQCDNILKKEMLKSFPEFY